MRRFHFKPTKSLIAVCLIVTLILTISGIYFWKLKTWRDLRIVLKFTETKKNFSILEMMGSTNVYEMVKPNTSTILMEPQNPFVEPTAIQHDSNDRRRPFAVILVTSLARYFNQRHAIRSTWYKWGEQLNIRVFFMIGFHKEPDDLIKALGEEQRRHNDLIIDDFQEGYYKLPAKVLRMLKWYNSTYTDETGPRFFIKTDQDVFLNLPNIVSFLKKTPYYKALAIKSNCKDVLSTEEYESNVSNSSYCPIPDNVHLTLDLNDMETYYVGGKRFENAEVEKDPDSKWYIDSSERERLNWPSAVFPTYLNGPCYVISGNAVRSIYETSFSVPIFPFEDVYIVGMIAYDKLNMHISNMPRMQLDIRNGFGFGMYVSIVRKRSRLEKILSMHPVDHPSIMWKLCRRISSCYALTRSAAGSGSGGVNYLFMPSVLGLIPSLYFIMRE